MWYMQQARSFLLTWNCDSLFLFSFLIKTGHHLWKALMCTFSWMVKHNGTNHSYAPQKVFSTRLLLNVPCPLVTWTKSVWLRASIVFHLLFHDKFTPSKYIQNLSYFFKREDGSRFPMFKYNFGRGKQRHGLFVRFPRFNTKSSSDSKLSNTVEPIIMCIRKS